MTQAITNGADSPAAAGEEVATCLDLLARIHDREADAEFLLGLRDNAIGSWLEGVFAGSPASDACGHFSAAVADLPAPLDDITLDKLASEYADIYLTHAYRVSPNGSVWLTEDSLERQEPMFETRKWYDHYGVEVPDWRLRPDDNLVHQLQFVAFLLRHDSDHARGDAARFLDTGLLRWLPHFVDGVVARSSSGFYRATAELTGAAVDEIRDMLARETGIGRPVPVADGTGQDSDKSELAAQAYFPGQAESW